MMTNKKILIGSIFAALLMVSMPFISALQTQQVATSTTTTSVQSANPTATITAADIANINLINSLANDLYTSLSNNPGTVTPEQMINIVQLSVKVLKDLGCTDEYITQKSIQVLSDKGYTIDAASFNQKLQAILNSNPKSVSSSPEPMINNIINITIGVLLIITGVILYILGDLIHFIPIIGLIGFPIGWTGMALVAIGLLILKNNHPADVAYARVPTGSITPMTSN